MKTLEVQKIRKSFGAFVAVDDVSFTVDESCVFGIIGPNGAGKTTTLRMVMNIIAPDAGTVAILGNTERSRSADLIGYLPEERGLYRKMKVGDLLTFMMDLKAMPRRESRKAIDIWLQRLDITEWKHKKIEELSKGMQQKVQFLGTIMHKPRLLILDEPFGGLDPINVNVIKEIMLELKKEGTSIIFSTHVMESAEKLCDEIFLINKGRQLLYGKLGEIKKSYGSENVLIEFEGSDEFLKTSQQIKKFDNYGNYVEAQLVKNADPQQLLREAMQNNAIRRFEIKSPSLNDIFIEAVNNSNSGRSES